MKDAVDFDKIVELHRWLGKLPAIRSDAETVKTAQHDVTRGCLHVRQAAGSKNVKANAESNHLSVR
jgi:hypothetical protein